MRIAVVADDLTGALDACAPMAARGLDCHIALDASGIEATIASGSDVACVNTASRERPEREAVSSVLHVAERLAAFRPRIVFKKVDSRLKGHVAAETAACLAAFGRQRVVVAPAIPNQRRLVENGEITGFGVPSPIRVADAFGLEVEVPDTRDQADLDRIAVADATDTLFVGAAGLGESFASLLGQSEVAPMVRPAAPMLIALGSHDPITLEQADVLIADGELRAETSHDRLFRFSNEAGDLTLLQSAVAPSAPGYAAAMERFGEVVADNLLGGRYASALLCGGQTAQTVMRHIGATHAQLLGSVAPGIPVLSLRVGRDDVTIMTKSGGFGAPDALATLCRRAQHPSPIAQ